MLALAHTNVKFPTPGDFWSGTFGEFFAAIDSIDVGLKTFAYLSTGEEIANPRFFRTEEAALARAQRKLAKAPKARKGECTNVRWSRVSTNA